LVVGGEIDISVDHARLAALSRPVAAGLLERTIASDAAVNIRAGVGAIRPESELLAGAVPAGSIHLSLNDQPPLARLDAVPEAPAVAATDGHPVAVAPPEAPPVVQSPSTHDPVEPDEPTGGTWTWESGFDDPLDDPDQPTFMPQRVSGLTPMGRLRFDDGTIERLNQPIVIGRSPDPHEIPREARAVSWDVPSVSRLHLAVRPKGDGAEIIDLGSKNGTFVVNLSATDLVALEPHVPSLIGAGIQVLLGERHFVFEVVTG